MTNSNTTIDNLEVILTDEYTNQRSNPTYDDKLYIHLSDLKLALAGILTEASGRWLDYGSNTSPYVEFFKDVTLECADIRDVPGVTYLVPPEGHCPAENDTFDGVLSTQVLEHVRDVQFYLRDCWRMLRSSGSLVLTTHGIWEDHGCPDDYWRWTADGLGEELTRSGFQVEKCLKLSTDLRAILQLAIVRQHSFLYNRRSITGLGLHILGWLLKRNRGGLARFADQALSGSRVTADPNAKLYLGLVAVAKKIL
jgi:SAM-dependent methyltransferase